MRKLKKSATNAQFIERLSKLYKINYTANFYVVKENANYNKKIRETNFYIRLNTATKKRKVINLTDQIYVSTYNTMFYVSIRLR